MHSVDPDSRTHGGGDGGGEKGGDGGVKTPEPLFIKNSNRVKVSVTGSEGLSLFPKTMSAVHAAREVVNWDG